MKKLLTLIAVLSIATVSFGQDDNWGSLYPNNAKNPYADRTACNVGDILTIVVDESLVASFSANTTATKKDDNSIANTIFPFLGSLNTGIFKTVARFLGLGASGGGGTTGSSSVSGSNAGQGSTGQNSKFTTKIAVTVKAVMPNGTMVVEGNRIIKVNKDFQIFRFSGVVRRDDVRRDNTVPSTVVANVDIQTDGKGLIGDRQRKGILTKILEWFF